MPAWPAERQPRTRALVFAARPLVRGVALAAALIAGRAWAEPATPPDVQHWLATMASSSVESSAIGDLAGHGTSDWAGIVSVTAPGEERSASLVAVFLQQADGHYRLAARSTGQSSDCGTSTCGIDDLQIRRQSVLFRWSLHWHGCDDEVRFQFKRSGEHWPLIGVVSHSTEVPYGPDESGNDRQGPPRTVAVDHNRLTGDAIVTQRSGQGAPRVTRLKLALPPQDLDGFGDFGVPEHKAFPALCGRG
jgi:hypothetical protein